MYSIDRVISYFAAKVTVLASINYLSFKELKECKARTDMKLLGQSRNLINYATCTNFKRFSFSINNRFPMLQCFISFYKIFSIAFCYKIIIKYIITQAEVRLALVTWNLTPKTPLIYISKEPLWEVSAL